MPFSRQVEPAASGLRPLADHRLAALPLLAPPVAESSHGRHRAPLLAGVAVLAVAGALAAGLGSATPSQVPMAALSAAPAAAATTPAAGLSPLLAPVAYTVPMTAAQTTSKNAVKAHTPSVKSADAPRGAAVVSHRDTVAVRSMSSALRRLRSCESGGNYREASGNGYYGAYQFDLSTWHSLGLSGLPSNASHQLQDVAVTRLQAHKGWGPWPVCSYVAGLR